MVEDKAIAKLERLLPAGRISTHEVDRVTYSYDATGEKYMPAAVVFPETEGEVTEILAVASEFKIPVIPRGAGTGLSGGSVPVKAGLVVSTERMTQILDIDEEELLAVVEPGVVTGELHRAVEARGLFYPPDPASLDFCTIGGNIAENAGGLRAVKYGVTRDYVRALRFALPEGEVFSAGVRTVKGVVGYDLVTIMVGSEGTLGFITQATLKLLPKPETKITIAAYFASYVSAAKAVAGIIARKILPATLEFIDRQCLMCVKEATGMEFPEDAMALLLIEDDGFEEVVKRSASAIKEALASENALHIQEAGDAAAAEKLWKARRVISPSLAYIAPHKMNEDVTVPRKKLPELIAAVEGIASRYNVRCASFGHAGDGNIHVNFLYDKRNNDEVQRVKEAVKALMEVVVQLGGTISGEHGIGLAKKDYIGIEIGPEGIEIMKRIKNAFDPHGIMNPGKIFPDTLVG